MSPAPAYYVVDGVDLLAEMDRLRGLEVFAGSMLTRRRPGLKVRRPRRMPSRLGFAVPSEWRISVTAYPGIEAADALETLTHELTHLHVGRRPGRHGWHGPLFRRTLATAMAEGWGIRTPVGDPRRATVHGAWAPAIARARTLDGIQLELSSTEQARAG